MCGVVGFVDFCKKSGQQDLNRMALSLRHRGPDDTGIYFLEGEKASIGLGHTRLSIQDLSDHGHQPMKFKGLVMVFNGEIYNFKEIRGELEFKGYHFDSGSDSEVVLKAFHYWGKECVDRFVGMFAFAIFNESDNKLFIFRDRAGVKPLYYYWKSGLFLFASELKALHQQPQFSESKKVDQSSLGLFLLLGYVPSPHCIFEDTYKLTPGHFLELDISACSEPKLNQYWSPFENLEKPRLDISPKEAEEKIHDILVSACNYRMISDAPVGIFLSGGYDSSLVTAILQNQQKDKIKTFTIGFDSVEHNEAGYAREIARYLGTEHFELKCSSKNFIDIFQRLPEIYDEPLADDSAIPTILLSEFAKKEVKVAISADGGDELFAGYNKYASIVREYQKLKKIPPKHASGTFAFLYALARKVPYFGFQNKLAKLHQFYSLQSEGESISNLLQVKHMKAPFEKVNSWLLNELKNPLRVIENQNGNTCLGHVLAADYYQNMSDAIVVKVERASMSYALETREPLLDHRLYEFVAQLPDIIRNKPGCQKSILKSITRNYLPDQLLDRPKQGFTPPLREWSNTKEFVELKSSLLAPSFLKQQGVFNDDLLDSLNGLNNSLSVRYYYNILIFQMWFSRWMA